jgi:predicted transposase/invertase (TIGR01784 family)
MKDYTYSESKIYLQSDIDTDLKEERFMKLLDLRIDFAFKKLFGSKGSEQILASFLNAVLKRPESQKITHIQFLERELSPEHLLDKKSILDIHAMASDGTRFNVEIQLSNEKNMEKRTLYYWSRLYVAESISCGQPYTDLNQTITINLVNFRLFPEYNHLYHTKFQVCEVHHHFPLTDIMEIHFIELPKFLLQWRQEQIAFHQDPLISWLLMLEAAEDENIYSLLEAIKMQDPIFKEAFAKWKELSRDPSAIREYEARHKEIMEQLAAVRENEIRQQRKYEEGVIKGRMEVAEKLLLAGKDLDEVADLCNLSIQDVEKIKANLFREKP